MIKNYSKFTAFLVTLSMMANTVCYADENRKVISFSDVPSTYWGYETIMDMTEHGIFKGTTDPVNGVGTFAPEKVMTRAEFITASMRAVYPEEAATVQIDKDQWWRGYYSLAVEKEILKADELDCGDMNRSMNREEMAMVMVRCVEKMGEKLANRVTRAQIADYDSISAYYQEYVRDCFSYGLLCGVDSIGTFAPSKSLTRAQAATVLCRLIEKEMRVEVELQIIPWEVPGAKAREEYTWEEYIALTPEQQTAFLNSFETQEAYDSWLEKVQSEEIVELPWENGGKQPKDYTYEEFEALTSGQQIAFQNSFESFVEFEEWLQNALAENNVQNESTDEDVIEVTPSEDDFVEVLPWEKPGAKQPKDYTYEEFDALTPAQQIAFQNSFDNIEAFEEWLQNALSAVNIQNEFLDEEFGEDANIEDDSVEELPWEKPGAKQPKDYTYEEFEALTPDQQMAFQNSFGSIEKFDEWLQNALAQ